jgi:hypothetical protein
MKILLFLLLLSGSLSSFASDYPALKIMPAELLNAGGVRIDVGYVPKARLEAPFPICYAIVAWYAYAQAVCKSQHSDCANISPQSTPSIARLAISGTRENYTDEYGVKTIPFSVGGDAGKTLKSLTDSNKTLSEQCFSLDQFAKKYADNAKELVRSMENIKQYFDQYKSAGSVCIECLVNSIQSDLGKSVERDVVVKALNRPIFDNFLYDILLGGCNSRVDIQPFQYSSWPTSDPVNVTYSEFIKKVTDLLKSNTPIVSGVCLDERLPSNQCKKGHSVHQRSVS